MMLIKEPFITVIFFFMKTYCLLAVIQLCSRVLPFLLAVTATRLEHIFPQQLNTFTSFSSPKTTLSTHLSLISHVNDER